MISDFYFEANRCIYGQLLHLRRHLVLVGSSELTVYQYLCKRAPNQKNKATLFSLKVEEKEVLSDFHLVAFSQRYGHVEVLLKMVKTAEKLIFSNGWCLPLSVV